MQVNPTPTPTITALLSGSTTELSRLRVNELVEVTLQGITKDGSAQLRLGTLTLLAKLVPLPEPGSKLILEVMKLGEQPVFRLNTTNALTQAIIQDLRANLPQQGSTAPLLATLTKLVGSPESTRLPGPLPYLAQQVVKAIPDITGFQSGKQLKVAIQNSGYFLEHKLLQSATHSTPLNSVLATDMKAILLRLQSSLQQLTPQQSVATPQTGKPGPAQYAPVTERSQQSLPGATRQPAQLAQALQQATANDPAQVGKPDNLDWMLRLALARLARTESSNIQPAVTSANPAMLSTAKATELLTEPDIKPLLASVFPQAQAAIALTGKQLQDQDALLRWLLRHTESSLSRIQVGQMNQAINEPEQKPFWMFEIPLRKGDEVTVFHMRIDPEDTERPDETPNDEKTWTARLAFMLPPLGEVHVKLQVKDHAVSTQFWLENNTSLQVFEQHVSELQRAFEAKGLTVLQLLGFPGRPLENAVPAELTNYLDENA